ncbi:hypothetical protein BDD12DRAFT_980908 [Trichophaea hybrida]|nr:hypothetical protein BDD12DRAFT_980908 [Trichophaea hybrida]
MFSRTKKAAESEHGIPQPEADNSSSSGDPWYRDPEYTDNMVNLLPKPNDERPRPINQGPNENGRWRRYIGALEDAWAECYDETDKAAREALAARAIAEAAQQETAELRTQGAAAE